ncbi:MAG: LysR family transcriptional regulator [Parvibaculaceae bacterium]
MPSTPNFTLNQLRYFSAVAEAGSFKEAADKLHIAQSALSAAISNLEDQLSVQLFIRNHARGVVLTRSGDQLLVNTRQLLAQAQKLGEFGRELGGSLTGDLVIGCFEFIAPFILPALLSRFGTRYPNVAIRVQEHDLEGIERSLLHATSDIALLYDINLSPRLDKKFIASFPPYVLLPHRHRLAGKRKVSLSELASEPFIQIDLPNSRDYSENLAAYFGVKLNVAFRTHSFEMVRGLVGHGYGYSILNQRRWPDMTYDGQKLAICELAGNPPSIDLVLAHVSGTRLSTRAEAFDRFCTDFFDKQSSSKAKKPR